MQLVVFSTKFLFQMFDLSRSHRGLDDFSLTNLIKTSSGFMDRTLNSELLYCDYFRFWALTVNSV